MSQNIIYHSGYNLSFFGLEKLHKFPVDKFVRIHKRLQEQNFSEDRFLAPEFNEDLILEYLTPEYKAKCLTSQWLSECVYLNFIKFFPFSMTHKYLCTPLLFSSCGTTLAALTACNEQRSVNIGAGFHHAWFDGGEGSCVYPDIPVAIKELRRLKKIEKIAVIDLDAHQGNGTSRSFPNEQHRTFIADLYNDIEFPSDEEAKKHNALDIPIKGKSNDKEYLGILEDKIFPAVESFKPEFIFFNAGTDIYVKDPLTLFAITAKGILQRDKMVFDFAKKLNVPIAMTLSGGYHKDSAAIVADSICENFR